MAMVLKATTDQSSPGVRRKGEMVMGDLASFGPKPWVSWGLGEGAVDSKPGSCHLLKNPRQEHERFPG